MPDASLHATARPRPLWLLGLATLILIVLADWWFYEAPLGWTAGLFVTVALVLLWICRAQARGKLGLMLALLIAGLVLPLIESPGPLELLVVTMLIVGSALVSRVGWSNAVSVWIQRALTMVILLPLQPILDSTRQRRWAHCCATQQGGRRPSAVRSSLNWGVPIILGGVFVALFAAANPIISDWLGNFSTHLSNWLHHFNEWISPARVGLWLLVGLSMWAVLRVRPRHGRDRGPMLEQPPSERPLGIDRLITTGLVVRSLVVFNLLFLVQTGLDVFYLWGGGKLPEGMTHAAYAHRGAYPLIATALLAGAFVLVTFRPGGPAARSPWSRRLVYLWVAQNVFLVVSAAWRLHLYIGEYSLTRWRIAALIWMGLVAMGLIWLVWRIVRHRSNIWLVRMNAVSAFAVLYICCFVSFDPMIAWYNVHHCQEITGHGAPIDVDYLAHLGPEALPAMHWLDSHTNEAVPHYILSQQAQRLQTDLDEHLSDWRGWTWRQWMTQRQLGQMGQMSQPPASTLPPRANTGRPAPAAVGRRR